MPAMQLTMSQPSITAQSKHLDVFAVRHHDVSMRTTVTLDDDVADRIKELSHQRRASFKETLNDVIRQGLSAPAPRVAQPQFQVEPHAGGFRPGIDLNRLNQLLDELDVEEFSRESGTGG